MNEKLDDLAFEFFREFARCEYCLKAVGLRKPNPEKPTADWKAFAGGVHAIFSDPPSQEFSAAIDYYLAHPPKKQVVRDNLLAWSDTLPDHNTQSELVLLLLCRVRNNLFHGGKFNGHWFEPQRSEDLINHGLHIMRTVVESHQAVSQAYAQRDI